ncbi:efflux RND transporter permease subunit [Spartinivicinus poritis]|uniref:Efflux RND transporter permease subunit n=1 Tax=Spartinivicinus poritis TaxID=2994640 RepID=A0ABT5U6K8_9GAMM|nr:efflux RND transporter permease subunit [Spartinivicinus sp. A2-2]MDE1461996.1 efflux RND transporter permease subunit [Spartinivicinus sp. A2-2]
MLLSDICIKRPVFASVISLLLIAFGIIAFERLPLREYPDIDSPIVSIDTRYSGAAANVVETRITQLIEDRISGLEGIKYIESNSSDGRSQINIEFNLTRDIDAAANDVRDRVSRILDDLPQEAEVPDVQKVDSNEDVIMWLNLTSDRLSVPELTDYAERYLMDRFSILKGVARVRVGGGQSFAMRIWIDRAKLAAHNLTVNDVEKALRSENVELPAGSIESINQEFTVRVKRLFLKPDDFKQLVLSRGNDGYLVRLGDVATVEKGTTEYRTLFRGNGESMVGIGITKQSTANTIEVARAATLQAGRLNKTLPKGMYIHQSYDSSVFIEEAINEVYKTLSIAMSLVIFTIYLFLGSVRAMLVPAITVPISLIATFIVLMIMGFTVNLLTLLALVLAIGLVVDDAIVVLENIHRRMEEYNEPALVAAFKGTRQVGFAVIATTLVLVAVFAPITVLEGDIGRLFSEFAVTMSAAVVFSSLVALTLSPVLASMVLKPANGSFFLVKKVDSFFNWFKKHYHHWILACLRKPYIVISLFIVMIGLSVFLANKIPTEYVPKEDRGAFFILVNGPEGATYAYMKEYMDELERRLMPLAEKGEAERILVRTPRGSFNSGIVIMVLSEWSKRRSAWKIMAEIRKNTADLAGVRIYPIMRQGIRSRTAKPIQFVIGGGTYEELAKWRNRLFAEINENNPGFIGIDSDYKETSPQIHVMINYDRAAELGVSIQNIGRTLESMLASRRVTTYIEDGEEYDVMVEGKRDQQNSPNDLTNIYVRSERSGQLIPLSNLVKLAEYAGSKTLNRYNRTRAITIDANLEDHLLLGDALTYLENLVRKQLPDNAVFDYKGQSLDYKKSGGASYFTFGLGILVMFLVLAAQFESYINPFIITLTVPLAIAGGLIGLILTDNTLNLYSQVGLVMLIGLAAKNGILIVEFANQMRDQGATIQEAITEAAQVRLRPIIMTSITTTAGSIPLIISFGAGAETRQVLGITLFFGVTVATVFTLFVIPVAYNLLARFTGAPGDTARKLDKALKANSLKSSVSEKQIKSE